MREEWWEGIYISTKLSTSKHPSVPTRVWDNETLREQRIRHGKSLLCACAPLSTRSPSLQKVYMSTGGFTVASCPWSGLRQCPLGSDSQGTGVRPSGNCDAHLALNSSNCQFTETEIWDTTSQSRTIFKNLKSSLKALKEKKKKKHSSGSLTAGSPHFHHSLSPVRWPPPRKRNKLRCAGPSSAQTLRAAWPCSKEGEVANTRTAPGRPHADRCAERASVPLPQPLEKHFLTHSRWLLKTLVFHPSCTVLPGTPTGQPGTSSAWHGQSEATVTSKT